MRLKWSMSAMITPTASPVTRDCWVSSETRVASAERLSMPVSSSSTARLRNSTSDRMSAVDSSVTATISAAGAMTIGGSRMTAAGSIAKLTTSSRVSARATPAAMPRIENREASVTTGIASHDIVATFGPPDRATLTAVMISAPAQAANITYSGRWRWGSALSARVNSTPESSSGAIVHHPSHGPHASSASASTANDALRAGRMRRSMSSIRSRSIPSRINQLESLIPACPLRF